MSTGNTKAPYHLDRLRKNADPLLRSDALVKFVILFLLKRGAKETRLSFASPYNFECNFVTRTLQGGAL